MHCVVGSGPSGIACARALLDRGLTVRMVDAGLRLEDSRARVVEQLAATAPSQWDPKLVSVLKENMSSSAKGVPQKLVYGSDFPYRGSDELVGGEFDGVGLRASLAQGGLSNVWGAAMMPCRDADLVDWPIKNAQLAEHYAAALRITGLAARKDDLASLFPLYTEEPGALDLSRQARTMLERMERNKAALNASGIQFGQARVAIKARRSAEDAGCVYCGLCMYGCPYGYIYNSASTLRELQRHERFSYQADAVVTSLAETKDAVTIRIRNRVTGEESTREAARVYLAAGTIPTTKLLLESRGDFDRTLMMRDSQYFLIPLLLGQRAANVRTEALHSLSQLFVEMFDAEISAHTIHLQIYSYSELMADAMRQSLKRFALNFNFLAEQLEGRLVVAQGFLHSDESSRIAATLRRSPRVHLELKAELNRAVRSVVRKVAGKLLRHARKLGAAPLLPMVQIPEPGRSFHSGGTFPMRERPGAFESDTLGRLHGWERVHVVDATVLPSIPATTITLTVMANAHRIAQESAELK